MQEVHFFLFEQPAWEAWLDAAEAAELERVEEPQAGEPQAGEPQKEEL